MDDNLTPTLRAALAMTPAARVRLIQDDAVAKERERRDAERCVWTEARLSIVPGDEPDAYASSCGEMWCWFDLVEHEVKFCFGCGKRIKIAPEAREETE